MKIEKGIMLSKPIKGIYNSRLYLIDDSNNEDFKQNFTLICEENKSDIGLMKQSDTSYEFLHNNRESLLASAIDVADKLSVPLVIM